MEAKTSVSDQQPSATAADDTNGGGDGGASRTAKKKLTMPVDNIPIEQHVRHHAHYEEYHLWR